jgi:threonine dehydrogenase-like Zn-dependent dehydrogenase
MSAAGSSWDEKVYDRGYETTRNAWSQRNTLCSPKEFPLEEITERMISCALEVHSTGKYPIARMITPIFPLEKGEEARHFFMEGRPDCIRVALRP